MEEAEGEVKKGTQMKEKHHRRTKSKVEETPPRKPKDLERMDMEELEGPSSGQVTPAEKSIFSDRYTAEMSLEEIQLQNKPIELKEWDLDNLDDVYVSLDHYCKLRRQRKGLDEGDTRSPVQNNGHVETKPLPGGESFAGPVKEAGISVYGM